jgi:hypothetical protein
MNINITLSLTPSQAKVLSGLFTDLTAGWLFSLLATRQPLVLTASIVLAILCLVIAIKIQGLS